MYKLENIMVLRVIRGLFWGNVYWFILGEFSVACQCVIYIDLKITMTIALIIKSNYGDNYFVNKWRVKGWI